MAPEIVLSHAVYTKSVDIWAIGILMHIVLTGGEHPLQQPDKKQEQDIK